ncbi:hypothetical protein [Flavobacterium johnsoniae]|uniref:Uncharacterized protein n=1 Tax=Flavobacterium johnsoniae TaxID=986 RepID=A0A1M5FRF4_FLAJO|nr:hypothetical protein [Flavobacterium johnsoniae]SHF94085.1 hypothetical protein SAMN05444388_10163 [Flavobacterium johnsoniae]
MEASLKNIKLHLKDITNRLFWKSESHTSTGTQLYNISNLVKIRSVIDELKSLNLFDNITETLFNSAIYTTVNDSIRVQPQEHNKIIDSLNLLQKLVFNFLNVLTNTIPEESTDSINIKLPPVNDFDELSKVSREIHLALSQVIFNDDVNGQTKIVSVENGSIWLNVFVGATAVGVIASLVWSAAVIYKKILEGKLLEEQIRGLKVKNESLEDVLEAQKASTAIMIEAEAKHINSEHFSENLPENIEKIKNSISIFADLIAKGAEVHPALVAPENVSNLFPDPTKIIGLESKIKKISNE